MDSATEASKNLLLEKTGAVISGIGQSIINNSLRFYKKIENSSIAIKGLILEKKLTLSNSIKNKNNGTWEDNGKKLMLSFLRKGNAGSLVISVEAGVMGLLAIKAGGEILELGCGDGFDAKNFFSTKAYHITAIDSNHDALKHASVNNCAPNITYKYCDFSTDMTVGVFDSIVWNRGPEEFNKEVAGKIISGAKMRLNEDGILSGSSNILKSSGWLNSPSDLEKILSAHFSHVKIKESGCFPGTCYFYASEKELRLI